MVKRKMRVCPGCKSAKAVVPVVYGFPDPELMEQEERGEVELGGCVVESDSPKWHCRAYDRMFNPAPRESEGDHRERE